MAGNSGNIIDNNLLAGNILQGVSIFGVVGTLSPGIVSNPGGGGMLAGYNLALLNGYFGGGGVVFAQTLVQYETATHMYYFTEYQVDPSTDFLNFFVTKVNKIDKTYTTINTFGVMNVVEQTSGGSFFANTNTIKGRTHDGAGLIKFTTDTTGVVSSVTRDGQVTFDTATDTFSAYSYTRGSDNKSDLANAMDSVAYTNFGDASYRLTHRQASPGGSYVIDYFLELQP